MVRRIAYIELQNSIEVSEAIPKNKVPRLQSQKVK